MTQIHINSFAQELLHKVIQNKASYEQSIEIINGSDEPDFVYTEIERCTNVKSWLFKCYVQHLLYILQLNKTIDIPKDVLSYRGFIEKIQSLAEKEIDLMGDYITYH